MDAYTSFAQVYDLFMDNVPYKEWSVYLSTVFEQEGITDGCLVDLGCGTGKITRLMAEKGYSMMGVDLSMDMLSIAQQENVKGDILYLMQDMQELDLGDTVKGIYSACDCMNYILEEDSLQRVFQKVYEHLDEDGCFVFDMNTPYKYYELLAENTFAENREEGSFIWENYFDQDEEINEYDLTLFIRSENGLYEKFEETHYQRCYDLKRVEELLKKAGFSDIKMYDGYSFHEVLEDSDRVSFIVKKYKNK